MPIIPRADRKKNERRLMFPVPSLYKIQLSNIPTEIKLKEYFSNGYGLPLSFVSLFNLFMALSFVIQLL